MPVCEPDPDAERSISVECSVGCTSTAGWQKAELAEVLRGYRSDHFRWLLKQLNEIESRLRKQTHPYGDLVASRRGGKRAAMAVAHRVL